MKQRWIGAGFLIVVTAAPLFGATSISRFGITWTFDRDCTTGQYVNGDPWVVGPVVIKSISPEPGEGRNGTMVNPEVGIRQGFDKDFAPDCNPYAPELNVGTNRPLTVAADSSVVSSITADGWTKYDTIQMFAVLTVVRQPPAAGSFRPPVVGKGSRASDWRESQLDDSRLKSIPRETLTAAPALADYVGFFSHAWLEFNPNWTGLFIRPSYMARNGYGRELAHRTGDAALLLNLDFPRAQKRDLLIGVVQAAIDNYGFLTHGGQWYNDGGHNLGRLAPLIIAAAVLDDPRLKAVIKGSDKRFQEFQTTFFVTQGDVDRVLGSWNHEKKALTGTNGDPIHPYTAADIGKAEWGIRHTGSPELDNNWPQASYRDINGSTFVAPTLAARLLGLRRIIDWEPLFQYAERHLAYEQSAGYKGEWSSNPVPAFHKQVHKACQDLP